MRAEDCILLRDESVDSGSLNRCIGNLFAYIGEIESRNVDEVSENYPDNPFYKDGVDNALKDTGSVYHEYGITDSSYNENTHGVVQRTYGGPLNLLAYRSVACRTESATGTYEYGNIADFSSRVLPNLESLHSPTYPLIFSSLVDDESAFEMANGVQTLSTTYFPTVKYTSYVLCSGMGVSFGTITFDAKNGTSQENRLRIDVRRDLVHIENARNIAFVSVSNGYASGIERISEDGDMVEDISPCTVTYLDRTRNDILVGGITKCDGGDRIRIDGATGRILPDDEESSYGETVELDNTSHVLSFFVVFEYRPPDVAFVNDAFGLGTSDTVTDYSRFMNGKKTIDGAPMTLDKFAVLDNYLQNQSNARMNNVRNVSEAFAGCSNATFSALNGISSSMVDMGGCFKDCTAATFESLTEINLSRLKSMKEAFSGCTNATFKRLETINVPAAAAASAFLYCRAATFGALKSLTLGGDASYMFYGCANATFDSLKTVDGHPSSTAHMFDGIKSATFGALKSLTLGGDASYMFYGCANATFGSTSERYADFNDLGGSLSNGSSMFAGCTQARIHIEDGEENAPKTLATLKTATAMFSGCSSVEVDSLNPDGALVEAEDMFRGIPGGVSVKNLGRGAIQNARGMFRESHTVGISGGDVFNVADMGGMFMDVGTLTLTNQKPNGNNDNANVAMKADSAFRNVTSQVFKSYPNCAISNKLTDADYMFALDAPVEGDKLFEEAYQVYDFAIALTRREPNNSESNAVVKSSITTAKGMFRNRTVSFADADRLFKNPLGGLPDAINDKYKHVLPVPSGLVAGDLMYDGFRIAKRTDGSHGNMVVAVPIPATLESAPGMFRMNADGNSARLRLSPPFSYAGQSDGDIRFDAKGDIVFSDALHSEDAHSGMFDGAMFDSEFRGKLSLSVKDVHTDYFAGSDFGFNGIAHLVDRSGAYWKDGDGDFGLMCGRGASPRTLRFDDLEDDVSKWFAEGVSVVNLFTPYPSGSDGGKYRLVLGTVSDMTGSRGLLRSAMVSDTVMDGKLHDIAVALRKYTPHVTFESVRELLGDNMTCMFNPTYLVGKRVQMTYTRKANPEYFTGTTATTRNLYVVGNGLVGGFADIVSSATRMSALQEAYGVNVDYPNATFDSLMAVCGVNMPFAFHGLQRASMKILERVSGDCANAVAAFSDMPSATFGQLSEIDIKNPFTGDVQSSTSFSNNPSHWNGMYYKMFEGDVFAGFEKLKKFSVLSSTPVHLERMFFRTGMGHIPDQFAVESTGDVFMTDFMYRSTPPVDFPVGYEDERLQIMCMTGISPDVPEEGRCLTLVDRSKNGSSELRFVVSPGVSSCDIAMAGEMYNSNQTYNNVTFVRDSSDLKIVKTGPLDGISVNVLSGISSHDRPYLARIYLKATHDVTKAVKITSITFGCADGTNSVFNRFWKTGNTVFAYYTTDGHVNTTATPEGHSNLGMKVRGSNVYMERAFRGCTVSHGNVSVRASGSLVAQYGFNGLAVSDMPSADDTSGLSFELTSENGVIDASNMFMGLEFNESSVSYHTKTSQLTSIVVSSAVMSGGTTVKPYVEGMLKRANPSAVENLERLYVQPCPFSSNGQENYYRGMLLGSDSNIDSVPAMMRLVETNIACLEFNRNPTAAASILGVANPSRSSFVAARKLPVDVAYGMTWKLSDQEKVIDSLVHTNGLNAVFDNNKSVMVGQQNAYITTRLASSAKTLEVSFGFAEGVGKLYGNIDDAIIDVNAQPSSPGSKQYSLVATAGKGGSNVEFWKNGESASPCRITICCNKSSAPKFTVSNSGTYNACFDGAYLRHCRNQYIDNGTGQVWHPADYVDMGERIFDTEVVPDDRTVVELRFSGGGSGCLMGCQDYFMSNGPSVALYNDIDNHRVTATVCGVSKYASNFSTETTSSGRYTVAKLDLRPFTSYARIRNNATNANWSVISVDHSKSAHRLPENLGSIFIGALRLGNGGNPTFTSPSNIRVFDVVVRRDNIVVKRFVPVVRLGKTPDLDTYALMDVADPNKCVLEWSATATNPPRRSGSLFDCVNYKRPKT